jgi:hypothetical protein
MIVFNSLKTKTILNDISRSSSYRAVNTSSDYKTQSVNAV